MPTLSYEELIALAKYAKGRIVRGYLMSPEQAYAEFYLGKRWEPPHG